MTSIRPVRDAWIRQSRVAWLAAVLVLVLGVTESSMSASLTPLELMVRGRDTYRQGVENCDTVQIKAARADFELCLDKLRDDPTGLGIAYEHLENKARYMTAWCWYRLFQMNADDTALDSAVARFRSIPPGADELMAVHAGYMIGELHYASAEDKWRQLLCRAKGPLGPTETQSVDELLTGAKRQFANVTTGGQALVALADLRGQDVSVFQSLVRASQGKWQACDSLLAEADFVTIKSRPTDRAALVQFEDIVSYRDDLRQLNRYLLNPTDSTAPQFEGWSQALAPEKSLRQIASDLAANEIGDMAQAARDLAATKAFAEAWYWRGMALLISTTDATQIPGMRTDRALLRSRQALDKFLAATEKEHAGNLRLTKLAALTVRKVRLLKIALGESSYAQDGTAADDLGRDDIKFLVRVAASIGSRYNKKCLDYLDRYLGDVVDGSAQAERVVSTASDWPSCSAGEVFPPTRNEARFYQGLVQTLRGNFSSAAGILGEVRSTYRGEARYIRGWNLYRDKQYEAALLLFDSLVTEYGSVRAAHWYSLAYRDANKSDLANDPTKRHNLHVIARAVTEKVAAAGNPLEYEHIRRDAHKLTADYPPVPGASANLAAGWLDGLSCPETLSVDSSGAVPQKVFFETLQQRDLIGRRFAQDARQQMIVNGLPAKTLAPASRECSHRHARTFDNNIAPIPDWVSLSDKWNLRIKVISESAGTLGPDTECHITDKRLGLELDCSWDRVNQRYVVDSPIVVGHEVGISIKHADYYPYDFTLTWHREGTFLDTTIAVTERIEWKSTAQTDCATDSRVWSGFDGRNFVLIGTAPDSAGKGSVANLLASDLSYRDAAYCTRTGRYIIANSTQGGQLPTCQGNDCSGSITLGQELDSPEGLAVDSFGNVFVSDWENHRVQMFNSSGASLTAIGPSLQAPPGCTATVKQLTFPSRLAFEYDRRGLKTESGTTFRQEFILITDRYGVHRFNRHGEYLDTPWTATDSAAWQPGSFGDISVSGYGLSARPLLIDHLQATLHEFTASRR